MESRKAVRAGEGARSKAIGRTRLRRCVRRLPGRQGAARDRRSTTPRRPPRPARSPRAPRRHPRSARALGTGPHDAALDPPLPHDARPRADDRAVERDPQSDARPLPRPRADPARREPRLVRGQVRAERPHVGEGRVARERGEARAASHRREPAPLDDPSARGESAARLLAEDVDAEEVGRAHLARATRLAAEADDVPRGVEPRVPRAVVAPPHGERRHAPRAPHARRARPRARRRRGRRSCRRPRRARPPRRAPPPRAECPPAVPRRSSSCETTRSFSRAYASTSSAR